jgi:hypothetical protein
MLLILPPVLFVVADVSSVISLFLLGKTSSTQEFLTGWRVGGKEFSKHWKRFVSIRVIRGRFFQALEKEKPGVPMVGSSGPPKV